MERLVFMRTNDAAYDLGFQTKDTNLMEMSVLVGLIETVSSFRFDGSILLPQRVDHRTSLLIFSRCGQYP